MSITPARAAELLEAHHRAKEEKERQKKFDHFEHVFDAKVNESTISRATKSRRYPDRWILAIYCLGGRDSIQEADVDEFAAWIQEEKKFPAWVEIDPANGWAESRDDPYVAVAISKG